MSDPDSDPGQDCFVSIVDVALEDSGPWTCYVMEKVHLQDKVEQIINLSVAKPYHLSLSPQAPVKVLSEKASNVTDEEVICSAEGGGDKDPVLEWQVGGRRVESQYTRTWEVREIRLGYQLD